MHLAKYVASFLAALLFASEVQARTEDFSGTWYIDLRTKVQQQQNKDCGGAEFILKQTGDRITGNHTYATVDCGRLNEGGENTVKGIVVGSTAILVVTSGRNGAIVMGKAVKSKNALYWESLDDIAPGQPDGEISLILGKGILHLEKDAH